VWWLWSVEGDVWGGELMGGWALEMIARAPVPCGQSSEQLCYRFGMIERDTDP
jgi:hypothetical protein